MGGGTDVMKTINPELLFSLNVVDFQNSQYFLWCLVLLGGDDSQAYDLLTFYSILE